MLQEKHLQWTTGPPVLASTNQPNLSHEAVLSFTSELVFIAAPLKFCGHSVLEASGKACLYLRHLRTVKPCLMFTACLKTKRASPFFLCKRQGLSTGQGWPVPPVTREGWSGTLPFRGASKEHHTQQVTHPVSIALLHYRTENL